MKPPPENRSAICTEYTLALKTLFSNFFLPKRAKFRRKNVRKAFRRANRRFLPPAAAIWTDHRSSGIRPGEKRVRRSAFSTTQSELHAIASAPTAGTSFQPNAGKKTPAASGMPTAL